MLEKIYRFNINFKLLTGLHIGGSSDTFDIGGADSTVIKNPLTHEPYIPGSSIKGKLRSLLTQRYGAIQNGKLDFDLSNEDSKIIANLFQPIEMDDETIQTSRAIFRDAFLTEESKENLQKYLGNGNYTEIKAENSIDSLKGKAANPRFIERVPAGAEFEGEIILQIYEGDDTDALVRGLEEALQMLELNYLGASGTRGYGKVEETHEMKEEGFKNADI